MKILGSLTVVLLFSNVHAASPQSLFEPGPATTLRSRVCINIGTTEENVGPYEAETSALTFPFVVPRAKIIKNVKNSVNYKRAFQVVRVHPNALAFHVQVDFPHRYDVTLAFTPTSVWCKKKSFITVIIGQNDLSRTETYGNLGRATKCSVPYFVTISKIQPDRWNRIYLQISGTTPPLLALACFKKLPVIESKLEGVLYVTADNSAEVYLNGVHVLTVPSYNVLRSTRISVQFGDVIALTARNNISGAGIKVAFIASGREIFSTNNDDWKARNKFPARGSPPLWLLPEYIDEDWPLADQSVGYTVKEFPSASSTRFIWAGKPRDNDEVYFRYRYTAL